MGKLFRRCPKILLSSWLLRTCSPVSNLEQNLSTVVASTENSNLLELFQRLCPTAEPCLFTKGTELAALISIEHSAQRLKFC
jgi:hypothetical protein